MRFSLRLLFFVLLGLLDLEAKAQVNTDFKLHQNLFLGAYQKHGKQWLCGMVISSIDSTNKQIHVRFDVLKDWVQQDSLECVLSLDTTQTYKQLFDIEEYQTLKYSSEKDGVTVFISVPVKHEYSYSNGMSSVSYQFDFARALLPAKWKKYERRIDIYYEK